MIPGILISALTFPGVIVHELAHQLFCRMMHVPVFEVKYFQAANPCGYVLHERSEKPFTNFMIAIGPFIFNTILGALILLPVSIEIIKFEVLSPFVHGEWGRALEYFPTLLAAWLGISILMHAFPSSGDAGTLVENILRNKKVNIFVKILVAPIIGFIYLGSWGSVVWLDFIYAIGLAAVLPAIIAIFL